MKGSGVKSKGVVWRCEECKKVWRGGVRSVGARDGVEK